MSSNRIAHPSIRIFRAEDAEAELRRTLPQWFQREFGNTRFVWATPTYYAISDIEGELIGQLEIFEREIQVGATIIRVGGIGGVITKPEWRMCGAERALLTRFAVFIRDNLSVDLALLLCRREVAPVYAKLGWERVEGPTVFKQPSGIATYPRDTMVLRFTEREWPTGRIDMRGLPL